MGSSHGITQRAHRWGATVGIGAGAAITAAAVSAVFSPVACATLGDAGIADPSPAVQVFDVAWPAALDAGEARFLYDFTVGAAGERYLAEIPLIANNSDFDEIFNDLQIVDLFAPKFILFPQVFSDVFAADFPQADGPGTLSGLAR